MEISAKTKVVFTLLPIIIGSSVITPDWANAESVIPINTTTHINLSEDGAIDISGGTQAAGNLFHSFEQFNLDQQQTANFITTPTTDSVIGQVIGGTASTIDGLLQVTGSNADLYLVNPAGLFFGPNARLDLGGSFTATTATHLGDDEQWYEVISSPDYQNFVTAPSQFGFSQPSTIVNQGQLSVSDGQSLRLLATQIDNTGTLSATDGEVSLIAAESGQTIHLGQTGGLLSLEIDADANLTDTLPTLITGGDLHHSDALVIDNNGDIALVQSPTSDIQSSFSLKNAGNISTQGNTGGQINLLGNTIQVTDSTLDASGNSGGVIRIGGDYQGQGKLPPASHTHITETTRLIADGSQSNGGQIIAWSDDTTIFDGTASAQSAMGDGGLVETSGLNQLVIGENTSVSTAASQGKNGLWLIDPTELTIVDGSGVGAIILDTSSGINDSINNTLNASLVVRALENNNITLQATNTVTINAAIDARGNPISSNLFIDTDTLNLNEQITLQGSGQLSGTASTVNVGSNGSIQNGVDAVAESGTVNLAATTYREGNTITLDHRLTLQGQGQDSTIISGDANNDGTGDHQVFTITSSGDNITLSDLTIQDGLTISAGAGLSNSGDNVLIQNTTFLNNEIPSGSNDGGAIHNRGSLTLNSTTFENNRSSDDGGAIDIANGSVNIINSTFTDNFAGGSGGAIDVDINGSLVTSNTVITNNIANDGGAIYLDGNVQLDTTYVRRNTATNDGGGIFNNNGTLQITGGDLFNNRATNGGGIALRGTSTLGLENALIESNQATNLGGGIVIFNDNSININNSFIDGNWAASGGGIHNNGNNIVRINESRIYANEAVDGTGGGINNLGDITITNSEIESNTASSLGGGLFNGASSLLTVTDSDFNSNEASNDGGGIYNNRGEIVINNSDFDDNSANRGGGLFNSGTANLDTVSFASNHATSEGGGLYNQINAISKITTGRFTNNSAHTGGAIYNRGDLRLRDNIISGNQAIGTNLEDGGAGILNTAGGSLIIDNSLIANNTSTSHGGGIMNLASDNPTMVEISNSAIVSNEASAHGGAILNASFSGLSALAELTVSNSTISGNQAATGGGIRTVGSTILTNVTVAENIATSSGGGISENQDTTETPQLINTIVANNIAPTNPDVEGQFSDQGNNLIGINQGSTDFNLSNLVGTINTPLNPNLTSLNNRLGSLSHQLLPDSPAANGGNNSVATIGDQHGRTRIVGETIDIGAVESDILPDSFEPTILTDPTVPAVPTVPTEPTNPVKPTGSVAPDSATSTVEPPSIHLQPVAPGISNLQDFSVEELAHTSTANLNHNSLSSQEKKSDLGLNAEQQSTNLTMANGRLHYFDEAAFQYLEDSFSKEYETYWQLPATKPVTLPSVQEILHQAHQTYQTEAAIIYATFVPQATSGENSIERFALPQTTHTPSPDDQLLLLLVSSNGDPVQHLINVSRAELTRQAKLFRLATSDPEDSLSYKALARQMYDWLFAPLQTDLIDKQIDHVMYSLDQGLRTIPLAAMMNEDSFVIEQYGISVIPSIGLTQPQFGNIDAKPSPLIAGADQFTALNDLPAVPIELDVVAQTLQSHDQDILLNEAFTIENLLKQQTSQDPNMLHLATHAEFNAGNLDESFIQFWDSPLTFEQMKDMPWSELELLILSACNTAISSPNAELGFIGLAAAAGIETSMGSLWNVSDVGTLALMAEFYAQLPDASLRSEVIQQAQIALLQGKTYINTNSLRTSQGNIDLPTEWKLETADLTHPFYWAGFTLVGNPWR